MPSYFLICVENIGKLCVEIIGNIRNHVIHTRRAASKMVHPRWRCYGSNNSLLAAAAATNVTNVLFKDHFPSGRAASGSIICVTLFKLIRE